MEFVTEHTRPRGQQQSATSVDNKKLRNRLSQQAFRNRQSAYIQDLERRLQIAGKSDNERIAELEKDNKQLREKLLDFHNKLQIAHASLASLSASTAEALQIPSKVALAFSSSEQSSFTNGGEKQTSSLRNSLVSAPLQQGSQTTNYFTSSSTAQASVDVNNEGFNDLCCDDQLEDAFNINDVFTNRASAYRLPSIPPSSSNDLSSFNLPSQFIDNHTHQLRQGLQPWTGTPNQTGHTLYTSNILPAGMPGVWSHNYQMGPSVYQAAMNPILELSYNSTQRFRTTNSHWSDHISGIRNVISRKWQRLLPSLNAELEWKQLHSTISVMFSLFNSLSRPPALSWYTSTKFYHHIADLTMWQLNPSRENYTVLHSRYRPSALQLTERYPPIIDWCPFISIRDRMILSHSANPFLDNIICDMATMYVVETDVSKIVRLENSVSGYIRVLDLIQAMGLNGEEPFEDPNKTNMQSTMGSTTAAIDGTDSFSLPAPTIQDLFEVKEYARLAFKALRMDRDISLFTLDPEFFVKYPELYDSDASVMATGIRLSPPIQTNIPGPEPFNMEIWKIYNHFADWCLNVICKDSL